MNLYFFRHGIAEERGQGPDFERRLTEEGAAKTRKVVRGMKRLGLGFSAILTSPYLRARQTAEIAAEVLEYPDPVEECDTLGCGVDEQGLFSLLSRYDDGDELLLVGHEPDMSELVSLLISGDRKSFIDFKKAGLCKVRNVELGTLPRGELAWLLTPAQLVLVGEAKGKG